MTTNEALIKQNFITKVVLKEGDNELPKELKVKIMGMRIKLAKVRKEFDEDVQEAVKGFTPEGYTEIAQKREKSEEESKKIEEWNKIQSNVFFMILPYYVNPYYNFDYIHNQWLSFNHYFRKGA